MKTEAPDKFPSPQTVYHLDLTSPLTVRYSSESHRRNRRRRRRRNQRTTRHLSLGILPRSSPPPAKCTHQARDNYARNAPRAEIRDGVTAY
jgi:hypothetical protein